MSTLEPQTTAKVRLHTTKGPIDIELWARETPTTSRIFLTNVLNDRFLDWEFARVVKDFLIQIEGQLAQEPFADEFNSRIRFAKRGVLGCVNLGTRNSNTGKFFITLKEAPELNSRNTAFGKVVGDGIFTAIRISQGELGEDGETPVYPVKVTKCEVLIPYFDDLIKEETSVIEAKPDAEKKGKKKKKLKVKMSFDDEEEGKDVSLNVRMKSAHDVLNDKKLAKEKVTAPDLSGLDEESSPDHKALASSSGVQDRDDRLQEVQKKIAELKDELNAGPATDDAPLDNQEEKSVIDKQREEYISKNQKLTKEQRELETLELLKSFESKISTHTKASTSKPAVEDTAIDIDDDFDNLDDSDESDSDIYTHELKFEADQMANEDLLVTIDESKQGELKKRRDNDFYRTKESSSIVSKKPRV